MSKKLDFAVGWAAMMVVGADADDTKLFKIGSDFTLLENGMSKV